MTYLKYRWNETRGDEHARWGGSWWYFEFGPDGYPVRQVEVYDGGVRLRYGPDRPEDEFGGLGCGRQQDMEPEGAETMTAEQFEKVWQAAGPGELGR